MLKCGACGKVIENASHARFCSACGVEVPARSDSGSSETPDVPADENGPAQTDSLECAETIRRNDEESKDQYAQAVRDAVSKGLLDVHDRKSLEETRDELRLSVEEASEVEAEAMQSISGGDDRPEAAEPHGAAGVALEINDNHFYMEDCAGVLDFRLTNDAKLPVDSVRLSVNGKYLGPIHESRVRLGSRKKSTCRIQIRPTVAGEHVIEISLSYSVADEVQVWTAQPILKVLEKTENPSNVQFVFDQRMQAGRNIGYGLSIKNEVSEGLTKGLIQTTNDLLRGKFSDHWQPIKTVHDEELSKVARPLRPGAARIVEGLAGRRSGIDRASIMLGDEDESRRIHILNLQQIRMGRSRSEDIVLRLFPRSERNDPQSCQITANKPHLILSLKKDGLFLADQDTANGTELNGKPIVGEAKLTLDGTSEIDVAKVLRMRITPFLEASDPIPFDAAQFAALGVPDDLWQMAERLKLRSVLIERVDNLAKEEAYLVLYRWANCGGGTRSELVVPGGGRPAHTRARLFRLGGQFWLQNVSDRDEMTIDGIAVPHGSVSPVSPGMNVSWGEACWRFAGLKQYGL